MRWKYITVHQLDQGAAEEVTEADTEGGHGQTGHVLVRPQVTVRKQYSSPISREPSRQQSIGIAIARNPFIFAAPPADLS